jgi:hypothetical protein
MNRHEIPTHLNVAVKVLAGLMMRQFRDHRVACGLAYGWTVSRERSIRRGASDGNDS